MNNNRRVDVAIIVTFACVAMLAMVTPVIGISPSLRVFATVCGVLLGPGILAYRLATKSSWGECFAIGVTINVAILMLLALFAVTDHYWHTLRLELLIPLTTLLLALALLQRKESTGRSEARMNTRNTR